MSEKVQHGGYARAAFVESRTFRRAMAASLSRAACDENRKQHGSPGALSHEKGCGAMDE